MPPKAKDLTGKKFGRLLCLYRLDIRSGGVNRHSYSCLCDCGIHKTVHASSLTRGVTQSCGCLRVTYHESWKDSSCTSLKSKILRTYRKTAKRRALSWNLTVHEFEDFILSECHYCGFEGSLKALPLARKEDQVLITNGVDRVDSSVGYSPENCVSCCTVCNRAKSDQTQEEWEEYRLRLATYTLQSSRVPGPGN